MKELDLRKWPEPTKIIRKHLDYRYGKTMEFIRKHMPVSPILDIGPENEHGMKLFREIGAEYHCTTGDLNRRWHDSPMIKEVYNTVFCFEVLEHLINPGTFLDKLKGYIAHDANVFVSVPRRGLFEWYGSKTKFSSDYHFHEFTEKQIRCLFKETGYEVIDHNQFLRAVPFVELFGSWRRILRTLMGRQIQIVTRTQLYLLRVKND